MISIEPILVVPATMAEIDIGRCLISSLQMSTSMKERPTGTNEAFKKLLQVSKAKTNKKLVAEAKLIKARLKGSLLEFESNIKFKCFVRKKTPITEVLDIANIDTQKIGEVLKKISLNA